MSQGLIDAVYSVLKQDELILTYLGLQRGSPPELLTKRFIKGIETDAVTISENVPQIQTYIMPGRFGHNHMVYAGKFCIDCYAKTSVDARVMADRAFKLLHDEYIAHESFRSFRCHLAYDTDFATGITGIKGYKAIYDVDYVRK
ncbi:hypothetical protein DFQ01_103234 [Paenibacillus cellulosilyticus]|uniref:Uncharacterized protein n=1 Tax=Paenibacillus cellulosilyticus TaxID=375489 RepID=A0A2V2YX58_9BACL|nr:hypothetical protein [Paenibacillus cellulosilyticus]PWW06332.1 hypothetical protein DFQ01_103234 [Paenibacillus cellulosilyticus]QKS42925.1 hypothetical protein HUB94_00020 [Paenibacillus cellulosilyticus]QKS43452.1 hypothetical protein HUB94_02700 [Paenibacillus cellulosilyticus]QKS46316.1 hypothetical protein HUB94_19065 [Paenibacillus cellulosilyticus]